MLLEKQQEVNLPLAKWQELSLRSYSAAAKQRSWKAKPLGIVSIDAFRLGEMLVSLKL